MMCVTNVTQTKGISFSGDCCTVGIFKKQGIPSLFRGSGQSYARWHGTWNSLVWNSLRLVCSTPQLAPRIGLYTASVVSLKDALIDWRSSDCDAPIKFLCIQINTGNAVPLPTWYLSPSWHDQKAFPFSGDRCTVGIFPKAGNRLVSLMRAPLVACRKPAGKFWQFCKGLHVF